jgi:hypothetical protein
VSQFFKGVALFIGVCCLVWVGVLWRWQATQRDMSPADIVLYLGLLPVVVFVLLVLGRKAFTAASERADAKVAAAAAAATQTGSAGASPTAPPTGDDAERRAWLQVLSAQVYSPAADTLTGLETACLDGKPRPEPDPELRDDEGLPVMCARAAELPLDDTAPHWEQALNSVRASRPEWAALDADDGVRRALAALAAPLYQAGTALQPWPEALGVADPAADSPRGQQARHEHPADAPRLRVLPGWPAHWSAFEQAVARATLQAMAAEAFTGLVAPQRVVWMADQATGATAQWLAVDALFQGLQREQRNDLVLVTACHSNLSEQRMEQLQREQRLYTAHSTRAQIPGEAAAALLLAPPTWPADPEAQAPAVRLHRPAVAQRDKPVDAAGKVSSALLENLAGQALEVAGVAAAEVAALCSDADQHTGRATELFGALLAVLPHLDAAEDVRLLGPVLGGCDATAVLLTAALAAQQAAKREGPCLALSVDDAQARLALVARPAPLPATA